MADQNYLILVMGVSGSGKSTIAQTIAKELGIEYMEADDFHSPEAKARMASGTPLNDSWREPWITSMCNYIKSKPTPKVLAWSGLKRSHRNRFRQLGFPCLFIHLIGDREVIQKRMEKRQHFMPSSLLTSQYDELESSHNEPDIFDIEISKSKQAVQTLALDKVKEWINHPLNLLVKDQLH